MKTTFCLRGTASHVCSQLGNQETMSVVSFSVDNESGKLSYASTIETTPYKACNISYVS